MTMIMRDNHNADTLDTTTNDADKVADEEEINDIEVNGRRGERSHLRQ